MPARQSHQRVFMADNAGKLHPHTHTYIPGLVVPPLANPFCVYLPLLFFLFIYLRFIIEQQHDMNFNECQQEHPRSGCGPTARLGAQLPLANATTAAAHTHTYHCHKISVSSEIATNLANCRK